MLNLISLYRRRRIMLFTPLKPIMFIITSEIINESAVGQECKSCSWKQGALLRKFKRKKREWER
jgi:hypothetical protein